MSKKTSKTSFRAFFPNRSTVMPMPIEDAEAGSSQKSEEDNFNNDNENQMPKTLADTFQITTEKLQNKGSKISLPNPFVEKVEQRKSLFPFGSQTVRSIVTPPRGNSFTKVKDKTFQKQVPPGLKKENWENNNNTCSSQPNQDILPKVTSSNDSSNDYCRICHDNPSKNVLVSPCLCKGTMGLVHQSCLERWLGESGKNSCEICGYEYLTRRKPKYTGCRSIFNWLRHPLTAGDTRNVVFDMACFCILTPLAAVSAWLCVLGAQHYTFGQDQRRMHGRNQGQQSDEPVSSLSRTRGHNIRYPDTASNSTWTSVGLLTLTGTLLTAYIVWLVVAFRFHLQVFRDWQTKNFIVTIVPLSPAEQAIASEVRDTDTAMIRSCYNVPIPPLLLETVFNQNSYEQVESDVNSNFNNKLESNTEITESSISTTNSSDEGESLNPDLTLLNIASDLNPGEINSSSEDEEDLHRTNSSPN